MQKKTMVKRSSARHTPSALIEQVDRCHSVACTDIEKQKVKLQAWKDLRNTKHETRWKAGTCASLWRVHGILHNELSCRASRLQKRRSDD